jgi:hypothetical protein
MKTIYILLLMLSLVFAAVYREGQWTGIKIMKEQEARHKSNTEFTRVKMTLTDKNGDQEVRIFRKYSKQDFKENTNGMLIVLDSPKSISGTALLTWDSKQRENDQWLYFPAKGDLQRVAAGSKKGYFVGTDFTFEDMEPEVGNQVYGRDRRYCGISHCINNVSGISFNYTQQSNCSYSIRPHRRIRFFHQSPYHLSFISGILTLFWLETGWEKRKRR